MRKSALSYKHVAASAALAIGLLAQVALAAEPETVTSAGATAQMAEMSAPATQRIAESPSGMHCSYAAPCIVGHTSDGWHLDFGGPGLLFERSAED